MRGIRVIFDEAHSEAWTIRPGWRVRCSPFTLATPPTRALRELLVGHDFEVPPNTASPLDGGVLGGCDLLVIAHPSDPHWERTTGLGSPQLTLRRAGRDRALRAATAAAWSCSVRPSRTSTATTSTSCSSASACTCAATPSRTTSTATARRPGSSPSCIDGARGSGGDLLAGIERGLLLPRDDDREPQRRPRAGAHAPLRLGSGCAADGRVRARRRPRRRARRLRPVRRRLHRLRSIMRHCG